MAPGRTAVSKRAFATSEPNTAPGASEVWLPWSGFIKL